MVSENVCHNAAGRVIARDLLEALRDLMCEEDTDLCATYRLADGRMSAIEEAFSGGRPRGLLKLRSLPRHRRPLKSVYARVLQAQPRAGSPSLEGPTGTLSRIHSLGGRSLA